MDRRHVHRSFEQAPDERHLSTRASSLFPACSILERGSSSSSSSSSSRRSRRSASTSHGISHPITPAHLSVDPSSAASSATSSSTNQIPTLQLEQSLPLHQSASTSPPASIHPKLLTGCSAVITSHYKRAASHLSSPTRSHFSRTLQAAQSSDSCQVRSAGPSNVSPSLLQ